MERVIYSDGVDEFEGVLFKSSKKKAACLLIAHAWDGPNDYFNGLAQKYCEKGFHTFAIDLYGVGVRGSIDGDNSHLMNPLLEKREVLQRRLLASFEEAKQLKGIESTSFSILGFCFGGLCALELARLSPKGLAKTIAVHSILTGPSNLEKDSQIDSEVLLLHGYDDPVAPPQNFEEFCQEMTTRRADWRSIVFGNTKHAFTFVGANIPELGIQYNEKSANKSWVEIDNFLREVVN